MKSYEEPWANISVSTPNSRWFWQIISNPKETSSLGVSSGRGSEGECVCVCVCVWKTNRERGWERDGKEICKKSVETVGLCKLALMSGPMECDTWPNGQTQHLSRKWPGQRGHHFLCKQWERMQAARGALQKKDWLSLHWHVDRKAMEALAATEWRAYTVRSNAVTVKQQHVNTYIKTHRQQTIPLWGNPAKRGF